MTIRRPSIIIFVSFAAGVMMFAGVDLPFGVCGAVLGACLFLCFMFYRNPLISSVFFLVIFVLLGFLYAQQQSGFNHAPARYIGPRIAGETIYLQGVIDSAVEEKRVLRTQKTVFRLAVTHVYSSWGWQWTEGKILVNLFAPARLAYGDEVILQGKLHYPFEFDKDRKFSYRDFLARKGVRFILSAKKTAYVKVLGTGQGNWLYAHILKLRDRSEEIFFRYLSPAEAGIMQAMVVGDTSRVPARINDLYIRTGTAHILAVSGFNVGIMAAVVFLFLRLFPIGRRWQIVLTIIFLIVYAVLAGGRPPVVRATIMAVVFLISFILERETDGLNSLFLAAFLILLMDPFNIRDVGFQLSFVSVLFIIVFLPVWRTRCPDISWPVIDQGFHWLSQSLLISVTAWIGVAGLIAYYFDIITPVTVLSNLVVVPLSTALVVLGVGLMFFGAWPFLAACFAACSKFILNVMIYFIYLCDQIPWAHIYVKDISCWHVIGYYGVIAVLAGFFVLGPRRRPARLP